MLETTEDRIEDFLMEIEFLKPNASIIYDTNSEFSSFLVYRRILSELKKQGLYFRLMNTNFVKVMRDDKHWISIFIRSPTFNFACYSDVEREALIVELNLDLSIKNWILTPK